MIKFKIKSKNLKGFTLIEISIVLVIVSILSVILLTPGYRANKYRVALVNDVDNTSSLIRDMQTRTTGFVDYISQDSYGFGVFFDKNSQNKVESFYKTKTDPFDGQEVLNNQRPVQDIILSSGDFISNICVNDCSLDISKLAIYYLTPKMYSIFSILENENSSFSNITTTGSSVNNACIEISSPNKKEKRYIKVYYVGQISFANGGCK